MADNEKFPIVGIGASAGGVPALEGLFKGMPDDVEMAFVIVTHLSPNRESLLHEIIGRYTTMPVTVADDGMRVEMGNVYVMPHNAILTMEEGRLRLRRPNALNREHKPIDIFFSSLAEDWGEHAAGVILSGGDSDGTLGAKAIKERGGLTLAQTWDGAGPRNPDMPQSAISSGLIDIAVPAEQMGQKLLAFTDSFVALDNLTDANGHREAAELDRARTEICEILRGHSGHDFSGYKTKTFFRRVKRRMQVGQVNVISAYIERLRKEPEEVMNLFRDLLINVTNFFRDPDAFKLLEEVVIPKLLGGKNATDTVRIWVPGCATGEEVFSLGILIREHMATLAVLPKVQIFATDIDEPALSVARAARYPAPLMEGLSQERRERFFRGDGESFVLVNEVRELCIFSSHSVIKDPPFSRMDMVSCRNLLIYFGPDIQNRVVPIFHYSLKPGGYLFLGTSESIGQHSDLFVTIDKKQRIFQAREHVSPNARLPLLIDEGRASFPADPGVGKRGLAGYPLRQAVEAQVMERFAPPHVVVNAEGDVVYYSARTGRYLEPPQGAPSRQLLTMARRGLRLELRAALREAVTGRRTVIRERVIIDDTAEVVETARITIEPVAGRSNADPQYLVLFESMGPPTDRSGEDNEDRFIVGTVDLERELRDTRERLQSTIEEYETALEEVKSSNEELVSVNEEAQSTNEELEASKEEMQSLNEELNTINTELTGKIEELDRANSDLRHLFESTQIATIFLDRNLGIRTFTPAASSFFNLRPADVGRPLTDLSNELDYPDMHTDIQAVFETGEPRTHQLTRDRHGKFYLVRIIPYRDQGARAQGVVVTLIDVTLLAEAEDHQRVLISELNHRVKNMLAVITSITNRTLETSSTKEKFAESLLGRLYAMSRAYGVLSRENWTNVGVEEIVGQEAEPFGHERFSLSGSEVKLKPQQGLSLGMVIHELATNAAKYGALRDPGGRVEIEWDVEDDRLGLQWREIDGPPVEKPGDDGFGLSLVHGEIEYRLGGKAETKFNPSGLEVRISFPKNP